MERAAGAIALLAAPGPMRPALLAGLSAVRAQAVPDLLDRLIFHGVDGLAWRAIASLPTEAVDPWLRATLRHRYQQRAAATLAQGLALAEILELLARAGIATVVMRGLRVIEWIYKDAGSRSFEDHDLLVRPADQAGARTALQRLRYEEIAPGHFRHGSVSIDLHTDPIGASRRPTRAALFPIDLDQMFRDGSAGWVAGGPALILTAEDEVLLLALHVVKHSFDRLIRTADLAHLVAVHGRALSWDALRDKAARVRALRLVAMALGASEMLGVTIPAPMRREDPESGLEGLLLRRVREMRPLPYGGEVLMALAAPRFIDRLRFLADAFAPRGEAPAGGWTVRDLRKRSVVLLEGAARQVNARRNAR